MDCLKRCAFGFIFFMIFICMHAQSVSSSLISTIKDDMRKDYLKQVKPPSAMPNSQMRESATGTSAVGTESLLEFSQKYKKGSGGAEYESKYSLDGLKESLKHTSTPINKLPDGYVVPVFVNGHWVFANPTTRVDGLVYPTGISLFSKERKKMSKKSKAILEHVFNMKVEE